MPKAKPCEHDAKKRCHECTKALGRETKRKEYTEKPEVRKERTKKWREANPEKKLAGDRRRRQADPERHNNYLKKWRELNPERQIVLQNENGRAWKKANPKKVQASQRRRAGMVFAQSQTPSWIMSRQEGKCRICGVDLRTAQPHVDHDHSITDGRPNVRGILCAKHNKGLGLFGDNIEHLQNAIAYLRSNLTTPEKC